MLEESSKQTILLDKLFYIWYYAKSNNNLKMAQQILSMIMPLIKTNQEFSEFSNSQMISAIKQREKLICMNQLPNQVMQQFEQLQQLSANTTTDGHPKFYDQESKIQYLLEQYSEIRQNKTQKEEQMEKEDQELIKKMETKICQLTKQKQEEVKKKEEVEKENQELKKQMTNLLDQFSDFVQRETKSMKDQF